MGGIANSIDLNQTAPYICYDETGFCELFKANFSYVPVKRCCDHSELPHQGSFN